MKLQLPQVSTEAHENSFLLSNLIANEILQQHGWISFGRYMELLLYAPKLGYYNNRMAKLGSSGDFITAPEITPLFGSTLAHFVDELLFLSSSLHPKILEFGAGSGQLAYDLLTEYGSLGKDARFLEAYYIIELSSELKMRQKTKLQNFPQVRWLDELPKAFSGIVIGNEVLDAMPVELVSRNT